MAKLIRRCNADKAGRKKWQLTGDTGKQPSNTVHVFWGSADAASLDKPCKLLPDGVLGLLSSLKCGMDVRLWHYGPPLQNAPDGVRQAQSEELLPLAVARKCMEGGAHIHHVADVVRLRACMQHTGTRAVVDGDGSRSDSCVAEGAWFQDVALIWLKPLPGLPSKSNHAFASSMGSMTDRHARVHGLKVDEKVCRPKTRKWGNVPGSLGLSQQHQGQWGLGRGEHLGGVPNRLNSQLSPLPPVASFCPGGPALCSTALFWGLKVWLSPPFYWPKDSKTLCSVEKKATEHLLAAGPTPFFDTCLVRGCVVD